MKLDIIRAWKDEKYRESLSTEDLARLPENPAGAFELSEADLDAVHGGDKGNQNMSFLICLQTLLVAYCNSMGACQ